MPNRDGFDDPPRASMRKRRRQNGTSEPSAVVSAAVPPSAPKHGRRIGQAATEPGVERPDGIEYRRTVVPDQGLGGRSLDVPIISIGADRHLARRGLHRSEAARGRRDQLPGRGLCAGSAGVRSDAPSATTISPRRPAKIDRRRPLSLRRAGRRPRSRGEIVIVPANERPGLCRLSVRPVPTRRTRRPSIPLEDLPQTDDKGKASFEVALDKLPATSRPLEAQDHRAARRARRPRGRAEASRCRSCRQPP